MFSKAASEGGRQEEKGQKTGREGTEDRKRREGSGKKGRDEAAKPIHTNYKQPLLETL